MKILNVWKEAWDKRNFTIAALESENKELKERLFRLVGTRVDFNPAHRAYTYSISIDDTMLKNTDSQIIIEEMVRQFASKITRRVH